MTSTVEVMPEVPAEPPLPGCRIRRRIVRWSGWWCHNGSPSGRSGALSRRYPRGLTANRSVTWPRGVVHRSEFHPHSRRRRHGPAAGHDRSGRSEPSPVGTRPGPVGRSSRTDQPEDREVGDPWRCCRSTPSASREPGTRSPKWRVVDPGGRVDARTAGPDSCGVAVQRGGPRFAAAMEQHLTDAVTLKDALIGQGAALTVAAAIPGRGVRVGPGRAGGGGMSERQRASNQCPRPGTRVGATELARCPGTVAG